MSEPSDKPRDTLWVDSFDCDGHCGASVEIHTHRRDTEKLMTKVLTALGWTILNKDEAYCPQCVRTAKRLSDVTARKPRKAKA